MNATGDASDASGEISVGVVRRWHDDEGWGVLDADGLPGGCWAHFSAVVMDGFHKLTAGETISFRWEQRNQDGYAFAATKVWRGPAEPADVVPDRMPSGSTYQSVFVVVDEPPRSRNEDPGPQRWR